MSYLILPFLSISSIAYGTLTALTLFESNYNIENKNNIFFNSKNRENLYNKYLTSGFTLSILILLSSIIFFTILKLKIKLNKSIFYIYSILFLLLTGIYYFINGLLIFNLSRLNNNYFSKQSILNYSFSFVLLFSSILILNINQK